MSDDEKNIRPSFIPADIDLDKLPPEIQLIIKGKIVPLYEDMVLSARSPLAGSVGMNHVFLDFLEVLEQLQLAQAELEAFAGGGSDPAERQNRREPYYRLQAAKGKSINALLRILELRKSKPIDPFVRPPV